MKLTYTSDAQMIEDGAKAIIKKHLGRSNSDCLPPSSSAISVRHAIEDAYLSATYTDEQWESMDKPSREAAEDVARAISNLAANKADKRWEAAMLLLGV